MLKRLYSIEPHTNGYEKSFAIYGPDITLLVDYDDVNHPVVDRRAKDIVRMLNAYPTIKAKYDELKFRMDGLEK